MGTLRARRGLGYNASCARPCSIPCSRPPRRFPGSDRRTQNCSTACSTGRRARACSTCCSTCPPRRSTAAPAQKSATPFRGRSSPSRRRSWSIAGRRARSSRAPFKVLVEDDTGDVELVFFLANPEWVKARLPVGATRWISGKLELYDGMRQIVHPDKVMDAEELSRLPAVEPVYPLTEGLYQRTVARAADGRAEAPAAPAGMGRRGHAGKAEAPGLRRGADRDAPAGRSRGRRSGRAGRDPSRLRRAAVEPACPAPGPRAHA